MSSQNRLESLLTSLGVEVLSAGPGSNLCQFPILDLLGNLRDEAAKFAETAELRNACAQAWERLVQIVESGAAFTPEDISWLHGLLPCLQGLAATPSSAAGIECATTPPPASAPGNPSTGVAPNDEEIIVLNLNDDVDLLREFLSESREHLDNIEKGVLTLETQPGDAETVSTIFRAFHTFKGSAGFLNLRPINRLAHVLESLLDLVRQKKLAPDLEVTELILRGRDVLKRFIDEIERQITQGQPASPIRIDTRPLMTEVSNRINGGPAAVPSPPASPDGATAGTEKVSEPRVQPGVPAAPPGPERSAPAPAAEVPSGDKSVERGGMVRVDTAKLDALLDLIGEMVISQSLVSGNLNRLAEQDPQFARNMAQLSRTTKELQRVSMSMRMVPVRGAFQKMARVVRDIGAKQGKKVQLLTTGEETELDRGVVEELNDPLLHMIRNSMDHGIENAEVRAKNAKPAVGTIHLRAYHQGGNIVIEIEDDGSGLNRERILAKALEKGLTTASAKLADDEVYRFIFAAGFSTAEQVTDLSGRGVGLDVVRRNIERLNGCIDIWSTPGKGTGFKITLPLTLAIIDGLVVRVGSERYIIPTLSVRESFRPRAEMITRIHEGAEVVTVRDRSIPLLRLYEHFGVSARTTDPTQGIVLVAQSGASLRCLLVDSLESKQEVVIKNLNEVMIHQNRSLAGAAILGDGRVGLILDVNSLVHHEGQSFAKAA